MSVLPALEQTANRAMRGTKKHYLWAKHLGDLEHFSKKHLGDLEHFNKKHLGDLELICIFALKISKL